MANSTKTISISLGNPPPSKEHLRITTVDNPETEHSKELLSKVNLKLSKQHSNITAELLNDKKNITAKLLDQEDITSKKHIAAVLDEAKRTKKQSQADLADTTGPNADKLRQDLNDLDEQISCLRAANTLRTKSATVMDFIYAKKDIGAPPLFSTGAFNNTRLQAMSWFNELTVMQYFEFRKYQWQQMRDNLASHMKELYPTSMPGKLHEKFAKADMGELRDTYARDLENLIKNVTMTVDHRQGTINIGERELDDAGDPKLDSNGEEIIKSPPLVVGKEQGLNMSFSLSEELLALPDSNSKQQKIDHGIILMMDQVSRLQERSWNKNIEISGHLNHPERALRMYQLAKMHSLKPVFDEKLQQTLKNNLGEEHYKEIKGILDNTKPADLQTYNVYQLYQRYHKEQQPTITVRPPRI